MRQTPLCLIVWFVCAAGAIAQSPQPPALDYATLLLLRFDRAPVSDAGPLHMRIDAPRAVLAEGRFGRALDPRRGEAPYFHFDSAAAPTDAFTLECWVRMDAPCAERLARIAGRSSVFGFYTGRGTRLTFYVNTKPNNWKSIGASLPLKKWTHIAGTFDGETMRLYLNGKLAGRLSNPGELVENRAAFYVGAEAGGRYRFPGLIDEVRLSKIARTEFMTGRPAQPPKPTTRFAPVRLDELAFERKLTAVRADGGVRLDGKLDDAVWKRAPRAAFVVTKDGSKPNTPTLVRAAYDDQCLYLAFQCFEKGQETQLAGTKRRDDSAIFKADCVETFLQPKGRGTPYFQIVANTEGGLWDEKWLARRRRAHWNGKGIRSAGVMGFDVWTIELAVPFQDLGAARPKPGDAWRVNFCRQELPSRELTAFSFTGGGFGVPSRFGVLQFGVKPAPHAPAAGEHELRGVVQETDGSPAVNAPVRTALGLTRTDAFGEFRLKGLPAGDVAVEIKSPRYVRFVGKAPVRRPVEIAAAIILQRVDPYEPAYKMRPGRRGVLWLKSSITEPPDMQRMPPRLDPGRGLELLAAPGEYESRAVAFIPYQDLPGPRARVSALRGPAGEIPARAVEVRWTQRLLKRVQYRRPREDAVFTWRFLWREPPKQVKVGQVRQLVVTVKVPDDAKPGAYRGALTLAGGGVTSEIPVRLRVAGFRLVEPKKRVGCYYRGRGKSDEQIERELTDIYEHDGRVLVWISGVDIRKGKDGSVTYDTSPVRRAVLLQKKHGIGPPFIVCPRPRRCAALAGLRVRMTSEFAREVLASAEFKRLFAGSVRALENLERELNVGEFVFTWMDEVMGRNRFDTYVAFAKVFRGLSKHRLYITYHIRNWARAQELDPWVDIRGYHGHVLDWWLGEGHKWAELKADIEKSGDVAWCYYNIREIAVTSEWVRLCNGWWLWQSPLMAHTPWTYYSCGGSPFDDLDSDHHDFAYAAPHPTKPEMVSTLEWECCREGYDDLRYVTTLERALAAARKRHADAPAVQRAQALLASFHAADPRVPALAEKLSAADYDRRRADMAAAIEALLKLR